MNLQGVIPPMITPFTADGVVDFAAHERNLERWKSTGLSGFLVLGSNSEAVFLNEEEKLKLIELTAQFADQQLVLAGTGLESESGTVHLTNEAAKKGAQAALIITPHFYKVSTEAMVSYFERVADKVDIPVLIYNVPKYTGVNLSAAAISTLSKHPNIIGMKDSSGNVAQLVQFQQVTMGEQFTILVGTAGAWYPALELGVQGGIMALANCAPAECVHLQALFSEGKLQEAKELHKKLVPTNYAVTATFGIAGLKYACNLRGFEGGMVRSPLTELRISDKRKIEKIFQEAELLY